MRRRITIPPQIKLKQPNGVTADYPFSSFMVMLLDDNRFGTNVKTIRLGLEVQYAAETLKSDSKLVDLREDEWALLASVADSPQFGPQSGGYFPWAARQFIGYIDAITAAAQIQPDALDTKPKTKRRSQKK